MPIYEYICDDCGQHYERIVLSRSTKIECPKCSSAKKTIQLSVFAAPANGTKSSGPSSGSLVFRRRLLRRCVRLPLMCVKFRIKLRSDENHRAAFRIQRPFHNSDARPLKSE